MNDDGGWTDWIMHDGTYVPGPPGTPVRIFWECGDVEATYIGEGSEHTIASGRRVHGSWLWAVDPTELVEKIVAYQLRRSIEDELDALRAIVEEVFDGGLIEPIMVPVPAAPDDPMWG